MENISKGQKYEVGRSFEVDAIKSTYVPINSKSLIKESTAFIIVRLKAPIKRLHRSIAIKIHNCLQIK